jgi:hypothetical protein
MGCLHVYHRVWLAFGINAIQIYHRLQLGSLDKYCLRYTVKVKAEWISAAATGAAITKPVCNKVSQPFWPDKPPFAKQCEFQLFLT